MEKEKVEIEGETTTFYYLQFYRSTSLGHLYHKKYTVSAYIPPSAQVILNLQEIARNNMFRPSALKKIVLVPTCSIISLAIVWRALIVDTDSITCTGNLGI